LRLGLGTAALGALTTLLQACSPLNLVNVTSLGGAGERRTGISFGPLPRHQLDVYQPFGPVPPQGWPTVLFIYGGTWNRGERADYRFVGEALASEGLFTVIADYRLYPEVRWPDFLYDGALALRWVIDQGHKGDSPDGLPIDPAKIYVMGHSAGAYNAAMLALDPRWLAPHGLAPTKLAGWIGLAGPYDFLPVTEPDAKPVFFHPNYPTGTQPIELATAGAPRTFLGAARNDPLVNPTRSTVGLGAKLQALGVPTTVQVYDRVDHFTLIGSLARPLRWMAPVLKDVSRFVRTQS
jgi:acetyl esterase/lipase